MVSSVVRLEVDTRREDADVLTDRVLALGRRGYRPQVVPKSDGNHTLRYNDDSFYGSNAIGRELGKLEAGRTR